MHVQELIPVIQNFLSDREVPKVEYIPQSFPHSAKLLPSSDPLNVSYHTQRVWEATLIKLLVSFQNINSLCTGDIENVQLAHSLTEDNCFSSCVNFSAMTWVQIN